MPRVVDKEAKKMQILQVAMKVFARKGVVKTKMIDIATEAGIGKGTIYEYFRSKEEIFASAFTYFFETMMGEINQAIQAEHDPVRQLQIITELSLKSLIEGNAEFADIMMDFWAEGVRNKNQVMLSSINLKGIYADYRKIVAKILKSGINQGIFKKMDINAAASVFIGTFDGIMLQWILDRKIVNLHKVLSILMDTFINGIKIEN